MTNNKEYRNQLKEPVEQAKGMHERGEYKDPEYGELCITVVRLIEGSEFGRKKAESELEMQAGERSGYDIMMDGGFDGAIMQMLDIAQNYLGRFGEVSVEPYSKGLGTRSAKISFTPGRQKGKYVTL